MKHRRIRPLILILLTALLLTGFAGCRRDPTASADTDPTSTGNSETEVYAEGWEDDWILNNTVEQTSRNKVFELNDGSWEMNGVLNAAIVRIQDKGLKDADIWKSLVQQFRDQNDSADGGWKGEFWGKLMRGASITYRVTQDEALYTVLTASVRDLLTTQEASGRISSYREDDQFKDWDIWCRKYVMLGLEYYHDICRDTALQEDIVTALRGQADYLLARIGDGEGKISIFQTSNVWGSTNSCSILEPMMKLYLLTDDESYLDFAAYLVNSGCSSAGNLFTRAQENKLDPYEYGAPKAAELISVFDGIYQYYLVTGEECWRTAIINFYERMVQSDVTLIGCCGTDGEQLNHSTVEQSNPYISGIMQETCVTVNWIKFCEHVLMLTGDSMVADEIERSAYNALLGAVNEGDETDLFDSYSPLLNGTRGRGRAGGQVFAGGGGYGCCMAAGPAGTGLVGVSSAMRNADGIVFNLYESGVLKTCTPSGSKLMITTQTSYPVEATVDMTVTLAAPETFAISLRIPVWSKNAALTVNGERVACEAGSYATVKREWKNGDTVSLTLDLSVQLIQPVEGSRVEEAAYYIALQRGPLVLASDARLGDDMHNTTVSLKADDAGCVEATLTKTATFPTLLELTVKTEEGNVVHLVDYSSAGKTLNAQSLTSVWLPTTLEWQKDMYSGIYRISCVATDKLAATDDEFDLVKGPRESNVINDDPYLFELKYAGEGCYEIMHCIDGKNMTVLPDLRVILKNATGDEDQLWYVREESKGTFIIFNRQSGNLLSEDDNEEIHTYTDVKRDVQRWKLTASTYEGNLTPDPKPVSGEYEGVYCMSCTPSGKMIQADRDGHIIKAPTVAETADKTPYLITLTWAEDEYYTIKLAGGLYLTEAADRSVSAGAYTGEAGQLWEVKPDGSSFTLMGKLNSMLLCEDDNENIHTFPEVGSPVQRWTLTKAE